MMRPLSTTGRTTRRLSTTGPGFAAGSAVASGSARSPGRSASAKPGGGQKAGPALASIFRADRDRPMESLERRCAARRERIVAHRAKDHTDADQWDLEFWQNQTPEMRLLALVELRNDLRKVRGRNRMFDDE